ncbi:hypothetical protein K3495_g17011, partial [Podosphaera aphanis]
MQVSGDFNTKPLRAQWKSAEQIANLRLENRCYRCEQQDCYARVCPFLPVQGTAHEKDVTRPKEPLLGPNGRPLRAKWKTAEQIEKLRMERRCFRCERQGCKTDYCSLLPAINPKFRSSESIATKRDEAHKGMEADGMNHSSDNKNYGCNERPIIIAMAVGQESKMNTSPFLVNALINDLRMIQALVDNG